MSNVFNEESITTSDFTKLDFTKLGGLIPAVVQDVATGCVLMVGFMNREALERTLRDRKVTFWSRDREVIWQKGETSGNYLDVVEIRADCDNDTILVTARPHGPTCHTGAYSCFGTQQPTDPSATDPLETIRTLEETIHARRANPDESSYTARLFAEGRHRIAQKVGEEGVETVIAAMRNDRNEVASEAADLIYHLLVLLADCDLSIADVAQVLEGRRK
jgi:phosphoribosyl-ATP pyrophosphohydrolase/phosphoribosyl-AMP cyclohydrolase